MDQPDKSQPVGALVFASSYTALGIVRSLGRHGIPVWVLGDRFSLAAGSRYTRRVISVEGTDEAAQVDFLERQTFGGLDDVQAPIDRRVGAGDDAALKREPPQRMHLESTISCTYAALLPYRLDLVAGV